MTIEEKLARSLTAESTELLPFLPYLLQDFRELGSEPEVMIDLIKRNAGTYKDILVLDLACGKGAVSVKTAQKLKSRVKGIDLIHEFVESARLYAEQCNVGDLCEFIVGDINESMLTEKDYDFVIFAAAGDILGTPAETLRKLTQVIKPGGFILIDECYISDKDSLNSIKWQYEYLTRAQWFEVFTEAGLTLIEERDGNESEDSNPDSRDGMAFINARATELTAKYPEKKPLFDGYVKSQQNEYDDIDNTLVGVTWLLKRNK